jgi:uncharacterized membrane protein YecN with MAPEG domain
MSHTLILTITPVYAALLALFYLPLSIRVIKLRLSEKVSIGDGGNSDLARAARVHANFAEYAPLALLLIAFNEALGTPALAVHALGLMLLVGRVSHFLGIRTVEAPMHYRKLGMRLTFGTLALGAFGILALTGLRLAG